MAHQRARPQDLPLAVRRLRLFFVLLDFLVATVATLSTGGSGVKLRPGYEPDITAHPFLRRAKLSLLDVDSDSGVASRFLFPLARIYLVRSLFEWSAVYAHHLES